MAGVRAKNKSVDTAPSLPPIDTVKVATLAMDEKLARAYAAKLESQAHAVAKDAGELAAKADKICWFWMNNCKTERIDAARRFAATVSATGFRNLVQCNDLNTLRGAAETLSHSSDPIIQSYAVWSAGVLGNVTECVPFSTIESAKIYTSPMKPVPIMRGLEPTVTIEGMKNTSSQSSFIFYRRDSKGDVFTKSFREILNELDVNDEVPDISDPSAFQKAVLALALKHINQEHGFKLKGKHWECVQKNKCGNRPHGYFMYTQGQWQVVKLPDKGTGGVQLALNSYLQIKPILDEIAVAAGIPSELSTLMIGESLAGQSNESTVGARGDYQIKDVHLDPKRHEMGLPIYDLQADEVNYDERDNPFFAMQAAAQILRDGAREVRKNAVNLDVDISEELMWHLATSDYNAGSDRLSKTLEKVKRKMIEKGLWKKPKNSKDASEVQEVRKANGEALFLKLLSGEYDTGSYGKASRGYPLKFIASKKLVYEQQRSDVEAGIVRSHPTGELSVVTVTGVARLPSLAEIARITELNPEIVRFFNRQFLCDAGSPISVDGNKVERIKILLPSQHAALLAVKLREIGWAVSGNIRLSSLISDAQNVFSKVVQKHRSKKTATKPAKRRARS